MENEHREFTQPVETGEPVAPNFTPPVQPAFVPPQENAVPPRQYYEQQPRFTPPQPPFAQSAFEAKEPFPPVKEKKPAKNGKVWKWVGAIAAVCAVVVLTAVITGSAVSSSMNRQLAEAEANFENQLAALEQRVDAQEQKPASQPSGGQTFVPVAPTGDYLTPAQVYQQNVGSVVLIRNVVRNGYYSGGGTGSGFVISEDGYVVTNYHVVEGGGSLSVVFSDNKELEAKLVGYDNANDVALLKVEAEGLQVAPLGDSDALIVGDQVAAIGNPLGELTSTMTVGYVSAKERDVNTSGFAINMIQTDAAINSGNSGGPLFNMYGQVVGITSAKYSGSSSSGATIEGIGFAIPINDVMLLLEDLMANGYDTGPYLGISVKDMDAEGASYYGLPMGAYVEEVVKGSCADKAGLQSKDIIIAINEHEVGGVNDLSRALRHFKAGDEVQIKVVRGGREVTLTAVLDQKPAQTEVPASTQEETAPEDWFGSMFPGFGG